MWVGQARAEADGNAKRIAELEAEGTEARSASAQEVEQLQGQLGAAQAEIASKEEEIRRVWGWWWDSLRGLMGCVCPGGRQGTGRGEGRGSRAAEGAGMCVHGWLLWAELGGDCRS